jgi:hypothetical protein
MLSVGRATAPRGHVTTGTLRQVLSGVASYRVTTRDIASTPVMVIAVMVTRMAVGAMS